MVVGVLANIFTSFGIGELSGAGFGPNYTILMKLGFEYFAPRILDEMEKAGDGKFQNTPNWKIWQRQMKLYSDEVMQQTLTSLLSVPQATLDAVSDKFDDFFNSITLQSGQTQDSSITNVRLDRGQGVRRGQEQGLSPFDEDLLRQKERAAQSSGSDFDTKRLAKAAVRAKAILADDLRLSKSTSDRIDQTISAGSKFGAVGKRPAGQSVRLEKDRLQTLILNYGKQISVVNYKLRFQSGGGVKQFTNDKKRIVGFMEAAQLKLTKLLVSYNF